ncbi:hypothetical protein ACQP60_04245 [Isoptericola variabilis]|uniref:hypothetical protein n=1 Tax=Isoptericola variabilis TaxID=139208 RepID=UPI000AFDB88F
MAATVTTSGTHTSKHANARKIQVSDGHLDLRDRTNRTIAVYAPGHWKSVELDTTDEE